jgi:hypothetical protein
MHSVNGVSGRKFIFEADLRILILERDHITVQIISVFET